MDNPDEFRAWLEKGGMPLRYGIFPGFRPDQKQVFFRDEEVSEDDIVRWVTNWFIERKEKRTQQQIEAFAGEVMLKVRNNDPMR